jgi:hypothetical protein
MNNTGRRLTLSASSVEYALKSKSARALLRILVIGSSGNTGK